MKLYRDSDLDLSGLGEELEEANVGEHLPRITGTKSQASTASSSATRDSGISLSGQYWPVGSEVVVTYIVHTMQS